MTPLRPSTPLDVPAPDRVTVPDRPPAPWGFDGVVGDVLVTVLLAAALAGLVGAVLFLLWRALPGA
jgi:hypothetical protein